MAQTRPKIRRAFGRKSPLGVTVIALVAAACSSSATPSATSHGTSAGSQATTGGSQGTIRTHHTSFGTIISDASGRSLYLFASDTGTTSTCYTACAGLWPPLTATGTPTASAPAQSSLLGTTPRRDGGTQVTYAGHPLYYYAGDQGPGDTNGQGLNSFGGVWDLLMPSGAKVAGTGH
jgi:predicted lipoprotein with Yx(FWY)xxD motif